MKIETTLTGKVVGAGVDCALMGRNPAAINAVAASCRGAGAFAHPVICGYVRTVLFVLSMAETACPTEITILPQRSPYV